MVFDYRAKMRGNDGCAKFIEIRNWMWENYGPGLERETFWTTQYFQEVPTVRWVWWVNDGVYYIYLKDEALTHFTLKFLNT